MASTSFLDFIPISLCNHSSGNRGQWRDFGVSKMTTIVDVSDLIDPGDAGGRSYREVNATKTHAIPIGSLVELKDGVRLFVVYHARDCDQTPLYSLSDDGQKRAGFGGLDFFP
jgi:hypothetical protein